MATALDRFADMKPAWDTPVMIESHLNGVRTKAMNPHTPLADDEIVEDAIRCWDAGACAIHAHNTSFDLRGEAAAADYRRVWDRVRAARPDIVWFPTACNNLACGEGETGLEHVALLGRSAGVRIAIVDTGLDLFATGLDAGGHIVGRAYGWDYRRIAGQIDLCRAHDLAMVFGVYEPGHLRLARHYVDRGLHTPGSSWALFLVGKYGLTSELPIGTCGMEPSLESLYLYLGMIAEAKHRLPWAVSIWGAGELDTRPIVRRAIELGGHVKVGIEQFYDPARNPTNLELLREAQEIAREVGRPLATQAEARRLYAMG